MRSFDELRRDYARIYADLTVDIDYTPLMDSIIIIDGYSFGGPGGSRLKLNINDFDYFFTSQERSITEIFLEEYLVRWGPIKRIKDKLLGFLRSVGQRYKRAMVYEDPIKRFENAMIKTQLPREKFDEALSEMRDGGKWPDIKLRPGARDYVLRMREKGYVVTTISASLDELVKDFCKDKLGIPKSLTIGSKASFHPHSNKFMALHSLKNEKEKAADTLMKRCNCRRDLTVATNDNPKERLSAKLGLGLFVLKPIQHVYKKIKESWKGGEERLSERGTKALCTEGNNDMLKLLKPIRKWEQSKAWTKLISPMDTMEFIEAIEQIESETDPEKFLSLYHKKLKPILIQARGSFPMLLSGINELIYDLENSIGTEKAKNLMEDINLTVRRYHPFAASEQEVRGIFKARLGEIINEKVKSYQDYRW